MYSMDTLLKYADLSDETRWLAKGYNFDFDISDHDLDILNCLEVIGEGEYTGITSGLLLPKMIMDQVPSEHIRDWTEIVIYMNIIVYEEFRHGYTISKLLGKDDLQGVNIFDLSAEKNWNAYSLLMSHCLSEVSNVLLYKNIIERFESKELSSIFRNIQKDEARHLSAWKELIKDLIDSNDYHRNKCEESLNDALNQHNASIGDNYDQGVKDTLHFFGMSSMISLMRSKKKITDYWFE